TRIVPVALEDLRVHPVDAQLRHGFGVQARNPHALHFLDDDVGHDVARLDRGVCGAGPGIEALDEVLRLAQLVFRALQRLAQLREVPRGKELQVLAYDVQGERAARYRLRHCEELQLEALRAVPRTDTGRIQVLHVLEADLQLVETDLELGGQQL